MQLLRSLLFTTLFFLFTLVYAVLLTAADARAPRAEGEGWW